MAKFPNVMFGITSKSLADSEICTALLCLGLDQILPETDSL